MKDAGDGDVGKTIGVAGHRQRERAAAVVRRRETVDVIAAIDGVSPKLPLVRGIGDGDREAADEIVVLPVDTSTSTLTSSGPATAVEVAVGVGVAQWTSDSVAVGVGPVGVAVGVGVGDKVGVAVEVDTTGVPRDAIRRTRKTSRLCR